MPHIRERRMSRAVRRVTTASDGSESIGNVRYGSLADNKGSDEVGPLSANCESDCSSDTQRKMTPQR